MDGGQIGFKNFLCVLKLSCQAVNLLDQPHICLCCCYDCLLRLFLLLFTALHLTLCYQLKAVSTEAVFICGTLPIGSNHGAAWG